MTHYHAVRAPGVSAFGAPQVIMSETARAMVVERGQEDWDSEFGRFPRLFQGHEEIPGSTLPTTTFKDRMTVYLGKRRVDILQLGSRAHGRRRGGLGARFRGHVHRRHRRIPQRLLLWRRAFRRLGDTLAAIANFNPRAIAPGRGDALVGEDMVEEAITNTFDFLDSTYRPAQRVAARGGLLKEAWDAVRAECDSKFADYAIYEHCLPFNVARAYDEARGIDTPRIWTAERDRQMWADLQG